MRPAAGAKPGDAPPSKQAHQWLEGTSGWSKSPLGDPGRNEEVEELQEVEDDAPAHLIDPKDGPKRIWTRRTDDEGVPLSDQADVDAEADGWASLWREGDDYLGNICPHDSPALDPLLPWALRRSAASFPVGTGVGAENIAPRAILRLPDALIKALCAILMATELLGKWPSVVSLVLVVLLPKVDGGGAAPSAFFRRSCASGRGHVAWSPGSGRPVTTGASSSVAAAWVRRRPRGRRPSVPRTPPCREADLRKHLSTS